MDNLSTSDMDNFCRLCAEKFDSLIPIFNGEGLEQNLSGKIINHLPIQVNEADNLPHKICNECSKNISSWSDFVDNCLVAETKLNQILSSISNCYNKTVTKTKKERKISDVFEDQKEVFEDQEEVPEEVSTLTTFAACEYCSLIFESFVEYEYHLKLNHPGVVNQEKETLRNKHYTCNICHVIFTKKKCIKTHLKWQHPKTLGLKPFLNKLERKIGCPFCSISFEDIPTYHTHLKNDHSETDLSALAYTKIKIDHLISCHTCGKLFKNKMKLKVHEAIHMDEYTISCEEPNCDRTFKLAKYYRKHKSRHEKSNQILFKKRQSMIFNKDAFVSILKGEKVVRSELSTSIQQEKKVVPNEFSTIILQDKTVVPSELSTSILQDTKVVSSELSTSVLQDKECYEKEYKCPNCLIKFNTEKSLNGHLGTCGTYLYVDNESNEKIVIPKAASFKCDICQHVLKSKINLNKHIQHVHLGEKREKKRYYRGKEYYRKYYANAKPTKCENCGSMVKNLRNHMRIHEKSFVCEYCNRVFNRLDALKVHIRTHTNERPYKCTQCTKAFKQRGDWIKHLKVIHNIETPKVKRRLDELNETNELENWLHFKKEEEEEAMNTYQHENGQTDQDTVYIEGVVTESSVGDDDHIYVEEIEVVKQNEEW